MAKHSTIFGLSPKKMTELLHIGGDEHNYEKGISAEQKKAELLLDRLTEPLLLERSLSKLLPAIPSLMSGAIDIEDKEPIGDLLRNPEADISLLMKVKNYNNKLSKSSGSEVECDIAVALYYGTIASALVFHDKKISKFSYKNLELAFSSLIDKSWMTAELVTLFTKARQISCSSSKKPHSSDTEDQCESNDSKD